MAKVQVRDEKELEALAAEVNDQEQQEINRHIVETYAKVATMHDENKACLFANEEVAEAVGNVFRDLGRAVIGHGVDPEVYLKCMMHQVICGYAGHLASNSGTADLPERLEKRAQKKGYPCRCRIVDAESGQ